jgi:hypothetical protein
MRSFVYGGTCPGVVPSSGRRRIPAARAVSAREYATCRRGSVGLRRGCLGPQCLDAMVQMGDYICEKRMKNLCHSGANVGVTVVEAVVALALVSLVAGSVYSSMVVGSTVCMATAQRIAAFGLCVDQFEQMRGADYATVTVSNYPSTVVRITHLGGTARLPLTGTRSNVVVSLLEPARKQITVTVGWEYRGRSYEESLSGMVFRRDAHSPIGTGAVVGGLININPNNSADHQFVLTLQDGNMVTRDQLTQDYPGYTGPATCVFGKPKGNGNQNNLLVNGQVMSLLNANTYQISSSSMTVRLYNDKINAKGKAMGKWWISITAVGADVVSY